MRRRRRSRGGDGLSRRGLLVGAGAALASVGAVSSSAYTSGVLGRGAGVSVADDPDALLGLEAVSDSSTPVTVTNNADRPMDLGFDAVESGVTWDVDDPVDGNGDAADPLSFSLAPGESVDVYAQGAPEVTTDITGVLTEGGDRVGSFQLQRTIGGGVADNLELSGEPTSNGASGNYEFNVENTGNVDLRLLEVGIVETTANAAEVDAGDSLVNPNTGTVYETDSFPIDDGTDSSVRRTLDTQPEIATGATVDFEFNRFQSGGGGGGGGGGPPGGGGGPADMRGADVRLDVRVENLSNGDTARATVELCSGTCDF